MRSRRGRRELLERLTAEGSSERVRVPEDGEELTFTLENQVSAAPLAHPPERPGFQKWLTGRVVAGT
jgi:hypothetical protein